jgi:hypothetical protein
MYVALDAGFRGASLGGESIASMKYKDGNRQQHRADIRERMNEETQKYQNEDAQGKEREKDPRSPKNERV